MDFLFYTQPLDEGCLWQNNNGRGVIVGRIPHDGIVIGVEADVDQRVDRRAEPKQVDAWIGVAKQLSEVVDCT